MNVPLVLFWVFGAASLTAGLLVVTSKNIAHAAFYLLFALVGVAVLFLLMAADFLALVQFLIYGGAIVVLLLFALMLTRIREGPVIVGNSQKPLAIVAGLALLALLLSVVFVTPWPKPATEAIQRIEVPVIGESLFTDWLFPFEIVSLVLLVALIGAIVIARSGDD
ncbi:MAG: NADH-quinone oxidoreductase subunit J [Chloroflexi bacterium]|nr:NADH-quinone oxidoreductase subunit J [Chloroflexota bacterium]